MRGSDSDDDPPRWRDASDDDEEPRDWEVEPEEEKEDNHPVLEGTAPVARFIFLAIVGCVVLGGLVAAILAIGRYLSR